MCTQQVATGKSMVKAVMDAKRLHDVSCSRRPDIGPARG
jgi:hypothetical protein